MIQNYNFEILEINFIKTIFIANLEFKSQKNQEIHLGVKLENRADFDDFGLKARLKQSFKTEIPDDLEAPFTLEVELLAIFIFFTPVPTSNRNQLVKTTLPQAAFPYLREHIAETTRKGGFPPLILNPMLFSDLEEQNTFFHLNSQVSKWEH